MVNLGFSPGGLSGNQMAFRARYADSSEGIGTGSGSRCPASHCWFHIPPRNNLWEVNTDHSKSGLKVLEKLNRAERRRQEDRRLRTF